MRPWPLVALLVAGCAATAPLTVSKVQLLDGGALYIDLAVGPDGSVVTLAGSTCSSSLDSAVAVFRRLGERTAPWPGSNGCQGEGLALPVGAGHPSVDAQGRLTVLSRPEVAGGGYARAMRYDADGHGTELSFGTDEAPANLAGAPDGTLGAVFGKVGANVVLARRAPAGDVTTTPLAAGVSALAIDAQDTLYALDFSGQIWRWGTGDATPRPLLDGGDLLLAASAMAVLPDGRLVVSGSEPIGGLVTFTLVDPSGSTRRAASTGGLDLRALAAAPDGRLYMLLDDQLLVHDAFPKS